MTFLELLDKVENLEELQHAFQYGDGDAYMDFDKYVVPHYLAEEDDTYSGWQLTLFFEKGVLKNSAQWITLNTSENGWEDNVPIPEEHMPEVTASLDELKQKLIGLGVPASIFEDI